MQADPFIYKRHWASAPMHAMLERAIAMRHGSSIVLSFEMDLYQAKFSFWFDHRVGVMRQSLISGCLHFFLTHTMT